jgi:hypothetical protein
LCAHKQNKTIMNTAYQKAEKHLREKFQPKPTVKIIKGPTNVGKNIGKPSFYSFGLKYLISK